MSSSRLAPDLSALLANLPPKPGVYRMYDAQGQLLYVGKAKNLRHRVRSYFQRGAQLGLKNQHLVQQIHHVDTLVTDTEIEALLLEDNLVKTHQPPFNILLKDDKRFPWLCITDEPFPRLIVVRKVPAKKRQQSKAKYYGPYSNVGAMAQTVKTLRKYFPIRQRRIPLFKDRPCMNYSLGTCPGPCQDLVSEGDYQKTLQQIDWLLKGRTQELLKTLQTDMAKASQSLNFEWASKLRDRIQAVEAVMSHQQTIHTDDMNRNLDVIGTACDVQRCCLVVLRVRQGKLIASHHHELVLPGETSAAEACLTFLRQYYTSLEADDLPDELVVPFAEELVGEQSFQAEVALLTQWLDQQRQKVGVTTKKIRTTCPQKGAKADLLAMAVSNAQESLSQSQQFDWNILRRDPTRALSTLQDAIGLSHLPRRMECYDISHVQGQETVASMVVFVDGIPEKSEYKRFKVRSTEGRPDDFQSMTEVIRRRLGHSKRYAPEKAADKAWPEVDLMIIDGGKGQLSAALKAWQEMGEPNPPMIALAKRFEQIYTLTDSLPSKVNPEPIVLSRDSQALQLLQQIRDEAHRFAVTYHRQRRGKRAIESVLETIPGLGPARQKRLLTHFGSLAAMKTVSLAELKAAGQLPDPVAQALFQQLKV